MAAQRTVRVEADNGSYDILIGSGLLKEWAMQEPYAVITDRNVLTAHGDAFPADRYAAVLNPGEESKNMRELERILNALVDMRLGREGRVVTFGGGVVGDIGGFAASCYKRGVPFVQVPTTLLAQVDSSVGGKVAVDLEGGKNLAGAFWQPELVVIDTDTLATLPPREVAAGMAEVIKYGYIADRSFHDRLASGGVPVADMIETSCRIKAAYVNEDPLDHGIRAQLNYGHTIGHALEAAAGYGHYLHGEAVGIGMVYAAALGELLGISPPGLRHDTETLLDRYGLPTDSSRDLLRKAATVIANDKKAVGSSVDMIFIEQIGNAVVKRLPIREISEMMEELI
ncbi:MAG: 3-dehydroquinate synthase [Clostridia bacterium]|nr:3-dehydroquinate synthase [Clostridia bacterium]